MGSFWERGQVIVVTHEGIHVWNICSVHPERLQDIVSVLKHSFRFI